MEFIDILTKTLAENGISKSKLLKDLCLAKGSFGNWEKRRSIPSAETVQRIADYLHVTTDYLLGKTTNVLADSHSSIQEICDRINKCCKIRCITEKELCKKIGEADNYLELLRKCEKSICLTDISKMCDMFDVSANYLLFGRISNKEISPSIPMRAILNKCEERQKDILDVMQDTGLPMDMFVLIDNNYAPVGNLCWTIQNPIIDKYPYSPDCIMELKEAYKRPECKYIIIEKSEANLSISALDSGRLFHGPNEALVSYRSDAGKINETDETVKKDKSDYLVEVH